MGAIVEVLRPVLFAFLGSCHTKKLVCDLLDRYVQTTDNDIDNLISNTVRTALMKGCWFKSTNFTERPLIGVSLFYKYFLGK